MSKIALVVSALTHQIKLVWPLGREKYRCVMLGHRVRPTAQASWAIGRVKIVGAVGASNNYVCQLASHLEPSSASLRNKTIAHGVPLRLRLSLAQSQYITYMPFV